MRDLQQVVEGASRYPPVRNATFTSCLAVEIAEQRAASRVSGAAIPAAPFVIERRIIAGSDRSRTTSSTMSSACRQPWRQ